MTIIQPNIHKDTKQLAAVFGIIIVGMIVLTVFVYIQTVTLRHDIADARVRLEELKVENAELKSGYYTLVDAGNLEQLAADIGLIKERNPQWAFASHF